MSIRPLPRSLDPLLGESLPGYVLRLAHRLDLAPARIAVLTGLGRKTSHRSVATVPAGRMIHLDPATAASFAAATRLTAQEVAGLCLDSLRNRYPPLDIDKQPRYRHANRIMGLAGWAPTTSTRYCPECLAGDGSAIQHAHGGAWQKLWRLPPVFACVTHRRLLVHRCPDCRQPAHAQRRPGLLPRGQDATLHPVQCRAPARPDGTGRRWTHPACGARLDCPASDPAATDHDELPLGGLLGFQQRLICLLHPDGPTSTVNAGLPATVGQYFLDLRLLAGLIRISWPQARHLAERWIAVDTIDDHIDRQRQQVAGQPRAGRHYDKPPPDALACGSLLALADQLLALDDPAAVRERLGPLIARCSRRAPWVGHFLSAEAHCSDGLRTAIATQVHAAHAVAPRPRPPKRYPPSPRAHRFGRQHIPQLAPVDWYDRHLRHLAGVDPHLLRRVVPLKLIGLVEGGSVLAAGQVLGLSYGRVTYAMRQVHRWARHAANADKLRRAVEALADELDDTANLVDYGRRRDTLATWSIPWDAWSELVAELRQRTGPGWTDWGDRKRLTASVLVWAHVTQSEPLLAPLLLTSKHPISSDELAHQVWQASYRSRTDRPGHHWPDLKARLGVYADQLTIDIDAGLIPPTSIA